jgi:hypothetical protein
MFDTVNLWLSSEEAGTNSLLSHVEPYLKGITRHQREDGQEYISGMFGGNYKASVSELGISLKGSIAKYFLPDNFHTLNRGDGQRAFEKMDDEIHLPMGDRAKVTRVDVAQNFLMKHEPETYYNYLGDCVHYKRLVQPKSLYYSNGLKTKLFYNKIAEAKKSGLPIPEIWHGANVLRYEMRFTSRLPYQFNLPEITASVLFDEVFYIGMVKRWIQEYETINKLHLINFNLSDMSSPKDFFKQLALMKINEIGQSNTMALVEDLRAKNAFNKKEYYSRLKKDIKKLCNTPELTSSSELVTELDKKVKAAKQHYR